MKKSNENQFNSSNYWSMEHINSGVSGAIPYDSQVEFKIKIIEDFVQKHRIKNVIEFGCGTLEEKVKECEKTLKKDNKRTSIDMNDYSYKRAELTISLDVIFHLIEDDVFHEYMSKLFFSSKKYVMIYSSNTNQNLYNIPVLHRRFTDWIFNNQKNFKMVQFIPNPRPLLNDAKNEIFYDFYIFEKIEKRHQLPGNLIVSLTSYSKRFSTLELTLKRILQQTVTADEIILWIAHSDFKYLPQSVLNLQYSGLKIKLTKDIGSYKKLIPALREYPESFIITLDDDGMYPLDIVEKLTSNYRHNKEVICNRAHIIRLNELGYPLPYTQWQHQLQNEVTGPLVFATTGGGTLYPPGSLHPEVLNEEKFLALAPKADDVWFYWMTRMGGSVIRRAGEPWSFMTWEGSQEEALYYYNGSGGNDCQVLSMTYQYGFPSTNV